MKNFFSEILIILIFLIVIAGVFIWQNSKAPANLEPNSTATPLNSPSPTPAPSATQKGRLTLEALKNAQYDFVDWRSFKLVDGRYESDAFKIFAQFYDDKMALGDINNDSKEEAAVVISISGGGSGDFRYLAIMKNNNDGPQFFTSADLGDRVKINSLEIKSGEIIIDMVVHDSDDGLCCPTLPKTVKYKFIDNHLVETK